MQRIGCNTFLRYLQTKLLERGWWIQQVNFFERFLAKLYYQNGEFTFLQIGAFDGVSHDGLYWYVQRFRGRGVVIEPLPDVYARLCENFKWIDTVKPVNVAIHHSKTVIDMFSVKDLKQDIPAWALGSSTFDKNWLTKQGIAECDIEVTTDSEMHLMDLIEEDKEFEVTVLQIDADRYGSEIIKMIDSERVRSILIKYERLKDYQLG